MTITVEDMVRREVHYCVSSLIYTLAGAYGEISAAQGASAGDVAALAEQAAELSAPIEDWEEAAREEGWAEFDHPGEGLGLRNDKLDRDWPEVDWRAAAEDAGVEEPYQREVYEHWIVSDWLADKLEAKGEKVDRDFAGMTIWARTTTGQAIYADSVMKEIAADLAEPRT